MSPARPTPDIPLRPPVFHILLALAQGDLHGLGIAEEIERSSGQTIELGPGTLYRSLKEMVGQGVIEEVVAPEGADPRRKYYRSSELGRRLIAAEATRLARLVEVARDRAILPGTP